MWVDQAMKPDVNLATVEMTTAQETWDRLLTAAVVADQLPDDVAAVAERVWNGFTAAERQDVAAFWDRQRWPAFQRGRGLAYYVASCADL